MEISLINQIVINKLNIVDVISKYINLKYTGNRFLGICPFHKEKTPSFHVNEVGQFYHCFGCNTHGNVITFLMKYENLTFQETLKKLAEEYGLKEFMENDQMSDIDREIEENRKKIYEINRLAARYFYNKTKFVPYAEKYFEKRLITKETIVKFGLGCSGEGNEFLDFMKKKNVSLDLLHSAGLIRVNNEGAIKACFNNRIMIPIINKNRNVIGFGGRALENSKHKYINTGDTLVFNKRENLYGINFLREGLREYPYIVVTEGYFDTISMHSAGFVSTVAALGTAISTYHLEMLSRYNNPVVLMFDGDEAGRSAAYRVLEQTIPDNLDLRVAFIEMAEKKEDPDSLLKKQDGKEIVKKLVACAKPIIQHYVDEMIIEHKKIVNLEEKLKIEGRIRGLVEKLPEEKRRIYCDHIYRNSHGTIKTSYWRFER